MRAARRHPLLLQVNTAALLDEQRTDLGGLSDALLDEIAAQGFDYVWLLGVWERSPASRAVSLEHPAFRAEIAASLPDATPQDICGSPFAIRSYEVAPAWGGDAALSQLRARLRERSIRLILDFVPNHVALDHPWVDEHPEFLVSGTKADLERAPSNYVTRDSEGRPRVFAHGRDPHFPGWVDTLQLDLASPALREALRRELIQVATKCDGVRCDMAMLLLSDVIAATWGRTPSKEFWQDAIAEVRLRFPQFVFLAEAYWGRESELQNQGFDFTYDKVLYDRLLHDDSASVNAHLGASEAFQARCVRFLENHDEARAATAFAPAEHRCAALVTALSPGLRLFHDGQLRGRRIKLSNHLGRRAEEPEDPALASFYRELLAWCNDPLVHDGRWCLLEKHPAWPGNTLERNLVAFSWTAPNELLVVAVNRGPAAAQAYLPLFVEGAGALTFTDHKTGASYVREREALRSPGLYVDIPPWEAHVLRASTSELSPLEP